jgi:hypothetical protein
MNEEVDGASMFHPDLARHPDQCPALVLNADYTPLSYYPLSLWPWQTAVKAVFLDRVDIVETYEREIHSPTRTMQIPSVIALRQYVKPNEYPAFTRFNLFLRDHFECQYCSSRKDLGKCGDRLCALQPQKRRAHPGAGAYAAAPSTFPPDQLATPAPWPKIPARLSP